MGEAVVEDKTESSEKVEGETEIEEIRQPRVARVPHTPTKVEWETHMLLHADDRSWCPCCVQGRAHSSQHVVSQEEERLGVTISKDCISMGTTKGEEKGDRSRALAHARQRDQCILAYAS